MDRRRAEIQELHLAHVAAHEEQVGGLDVAMNDALVVQGRQRRRDAAREHERVAGREEPRRGSARREGVVRAGAQEPAQILPLEPLHREIGRAVGGDPVRHVLDERGVAHLGEGRRLPREALPRGGVFGGDHLERDRAAGVPIGGAEQATHAAARDLGFEREAPRDDVPRLHVT